MDKTYGLGSTIKTMRIKAGVTQLELAAACDLERSSITNIEAGNQALTLKTLFDVAEALGCEARIQFVRKTRD